MGTGIEQIVEDLHSALIRLTQYLDARQQSQARQDEQIIVGLQAYDRFLAIQRKRKRKGKKARAILILLNKHGPLTGREIHDALKDGTVISATYVTLKRLVRNGEIIATQVDAPSGHSVNQYSIDQGHIKRESEKD